MARRADTTGANTLSEIILGLPGDSKRKHFKTVETIVNSGVNVVAVPYGALYTGVPVSTNGAPGATITVPVTVTNSGTRTWTAGKVNLAYHLYLGGQVFVWDGARTALPSVGPDGTATVMATVKVPATARDYEIRFDLVEEGVTWFSGQGVPTGNLLLTVR